MALPNNPTPEYKRNAPTWRYLRDVFDGMRSWVEILPDGNIRPTSKSTRYLPKWASENSDNYTARLASTPFDKRFAQAIVKFTRFLFKNPVSFADVPPVMDAHCAAPDRAGSPFASFAYDVAISALRDGHSLVLVDFPTQDASIRSQADLMASGRRPYWVHYEALDLIRWRSEIINGVEVLTLAVLRETVTVPDGDFDEVEVEQYRVLRPGAWELIQIQKDKQGKEFAVVIDSGTMSLPFIPLVPIYGGLKQGFFKSKPALEELADLNVAHYQTRSDHRTKIHKCSLPVPVLKDALRGDSEPLVIGPDSFVHIKDPAGSFQWAEPLSTSLEQSRRECLDLEATMDIIGASYLINPSDRQAAATTLAQVVELESSLQKFAEDLSSGFTEVLRVHAAWLRLSSGGTATFSGNVIQDKGTDPQMLSIMSSLPERDLLSKRSFLEWLRNSEYIAGLDVEQEISIVGEAVKTERVTQTRSQPS